MIWYGKGDAQFIFKHPERLHRMIFHQIINYPIIKNFNAIKKGYFKSIPFFLLYGFIRFTSMILNLLKFLINDQKMIISIVHKLNLQINFFIKFNWKN